MVRRRKRCAMLACMMFLTIFSFVPAKEAQAEYDEINILDGAVFFGSSTQTIKIRAIMKNWENSYFNGTYYETLSNNLAGIYVYKGQELVDSKDFLYSKEAYQDKKPVTFKFKAKGYGKYKLQVRHGITNGKRSIWVVNEYAEATFYVKKVSGYKSYKPKYSVSYNSGKVTLSGFGSASSTKIYRSNSKKGNYSLIKTTTKDSYTDNKASDGQDYFYKIRTTLKSGGKTYTSKLSAASGVYLSFPEKPTLKSVSYVKEEGVKVSWKNAAGYTKDGVEIRIERATEKNGTYYSIGKAGGGKKVYYDKNVESGKTYYYRIYAARPLNNYCSQSSSIKKVTIP